MMNMSLKNLLLAVLAYCSMLLAANGQAASPAHNPDDWRENYAYTLGVQAYIFGYPYVSMPALRWAYVAMPRPNDMAPSAPLNQFFHFRKLADASYQGGGGTNNDTLYSTAWLDLTKEPIILSHPDMGDRYFRFQLASMDSDDFGSVGKRDTGSAAGSFALVGPDWQGQLPPGILKVIRSRTNHGFILGRVLVDSPEDAKAVNVLQDQFTLVPVSLWGKPGAVLPASRDVWKPFDRKTDPLADWKTMNRALAEDPPEARLAPLLHMFETIGVGPGLDVEAQDDATKRGLARAAVDGRQMLDDINASSHPFVWTSRNGWDISPKTFGHAGLSDDFLRRGAINYSGVVSTVIEEATYYQSNTAGNGEYYDGAMDYTMTFPPGGLPKVSGFWSVTMYSVDENHTFNLVPNSIKRYSIGDRTPNVKTNADGSMTIYIQSKSPGKEKESNWLPSPPKGPFTLTFRAYIPGEDIVSQKWFPPAVVSAGDSGNQ